MSDQGLDRLISAAEVERWTYCPLSWKLERMKAPETGPQLAEGESAHRDFSSRLEKVRRSQRTAAESRVTTWAFLAVSSIFVVLGFSLAFLTSVGFMDLLVWRITVVSLSVVTVGISMIIYFRLMVRDKGVLRNLISGADIGEIREKIGMSFMPFLFYLFGIYLLINGILLLQPFGIRIETIASIMTVSLIVVYLFLLFFFLAFLRSRHLELFRGHFSILSGLSVGLLLSLSVLFLFLTDTMGMGENLGYVLLLISFVWFLGALAFDLLNYRKRARKKLSASRGLPVVVLSIIASVFAASAFISSGEHPDHFYLLSISFSGLWLLGAIFFFRRGITLSRNARKDLKRMSLSEGSMVVSTDPVEKGRRPKPLRSKRHFLIGSPDLVIEESGLKVPVELKVGKVPDQPHLSHVMQLGAYLILVDVTYEQRSTHGYLEYRSREGQSKRFRIEWDMLTKAMVLQKVTEIREAERTDEVHRNHERIGKCRNCSRRIGCPESLVEGSGR